MIAFVDGIVAELRESGVVIQAGPLGLEVFAPKATLMRLDLGEAVRLHTHLVVRDDGFTLYGFHDEDMLTLFGYLIGVSGVGPKLALAILSTLATPIIATAIVNEDPALLTSTPGVGKRTAEHIVLDLKNKLPEQLMAGSGKVRPQSVMGEAGGGCGAGAPVARLPGGSRQGCGGRVGPGLARGERRGTHSQGPCEAQIGADRTALGRG